MTGNSSSKYTLHFICFALPFLHSSQCTEFWAHFQN